MWFGEKRARAPAAAGGGGERGGDGLGHGAEAEGWSAFEPASEADGRLEVFAFDGVVHLGQMRVGLRRPIPLAQAREVVLVTRGGRGRAAPPPVQLDGEPWALPAAGARIAISAANEAVLLRNNGSAVGGWETNGVARILGDLLIGMHKYGI